MATRFTVAPINLNGNKQTVKIYGDIFRSGNTGGPQALNGIHSLLCRLRELTSRSQMWDAEPEKMGV